MPNRVKTLQKPKFYSQRAHNSFKLPLKLNFYFLQYTIRFSGPQCLFCLNDLFTLYFTNKPNLSSLANHELNLISFSKKPFSPYFSEHSYFLKFQPIKIYEKKCEF